MNNTKSFETKQKTHVTTQPPQVHEESFENREKISTHRDWSWTPKTNQKLEKNRKEINASHRTDDIGEPVDHCVHRL